MKQRLDKRLLDLGLFDTRARAQAAIAAGGVTVDGAPARAAHQPVNENTVITARAEHDWVGRGGLKLAAAHADIAGVEQRQRAGGRRGEADIAVALRTRGVAFRRGGALDELDRDDVADEARAPACVIN